MPLWISHHDNGGVKSRSCSCLVASILWFVFVVLCLVCFLRVYGWGVVLVVIYMKTGCGFLLLVYVGRWISWHVCGLFFDVCVSYIGWLRYVLLLIGASLGAGRNATFRRDTFSRWSVCVYLFNCVGGFCLVRHSSGVVWIVLGCYSVECLHFKHWFGILSSYGGAE